MRKSAILIFGLFVNFYCFCQLAESIKINLIIIAGQSNAAGRGELNDSISLNTPSSWIFNQNNKMFERTSFAQDQKNEWNGFHNYNSAAKVNDGQPYAGYNVISGIDYALSYDSSYVNVFLLVARGGSGIEMWQRDYSANNYQPKEGISADINLFQELNQNLAAILNNYPKTDLKALIFMQGENHAGLRDFQGYLNDDPRFITLRTDTDTLYGDYKFALSRFLSDFLNHPGVPNNLPIIITEAGRWDCEGVEVNVKSRNNLFCIDSETEPFYLLNRHLQRSVKNLSYEGMNIHLVSSKGLSNRLNKGNADLYHFSSLALFKLGQRIAIILNQLSNDPR